MSVDPLAVVALLISLGSLGLAVEGRWRDRYKLDCAASMSTTYGGDQETYTIEVDVTNRGRRPISVVAIDFADHQESISARYPIRSHIYGGIGDKECPISLTENQTKRFSTSDLTRAELLRNTKNIDVLVRDSRGNVYTSTIDNDAYTGATIEAEAKVLYNNGGA